MEDWYLCVTSILNILSQCVLARGTDVMFYLVLSSQFFTVSPSHALSSWDSEVWTLCLCTVWKFSRSWPFWRSCFFVLKVDVTLEALSEDHLLLKRYFSCWCEALYRGCVAALLFVSVLFVFSPYWTPVVACFCIVLHFLLRNYVELPGVFVTGKILMWNSLSWMVWIMKSQWKNLSSCPQCILFIKWMRFLFTQK